MERKVLYYKEKESLFLESPVSDVQSLKSASSYVNSNPVNFNDPSGHAMGSRPQFAYMMNTGSASWLNEGAYYSFYSNLYGGNVTFSGGAGGGGNSQSGFWQPVYETTMTTSDKVVWSEELQAWVGGEMVVTSTQVGIVWVEYGGGSGTSGSSAIGAIRELAGVFLKESFNFGNRWPFYVLKGGSCQDYAYGLRDRLQEENLHYWNPVVYSRELYINGVLVDAHFSVVLEPVNGNTMPNTWIDSYTSPYLIGGVKEGITIITPSIYLIYKRWE